MTAVETAQTFKMEWRQCPGCKLEFKVLTTSPQIFHSKACEIENQGKSTAPVKKMRPWEGLKIEQQTLGSGVKTMKPKPFLLGPHRNKPTQIAVELTNTQEEAVIKEPEIPPPAPPEEPEALLVEEQSVQPEPSPIEEPPFEVPAEPPVAGDLEAKWRSYVERAAKVVSRMAQNRLEVATIALEACDIYQGGGAHWSGHEGIYTIKRFAEEIGINPKTLSNWVRTKRNVYDKLVQAGHEVDVVRDWAAMTRTADTCTAKETPEQVKKKFGKIDPAKGPMNPEKYFIQGLRRIRSLNYYLTEHKPKKKAFAPEDLKELKSACRSIIRWLDA